MSKVVALALAVLPACVPHDPSVVVDEELNERLFEEASRLAEPEKDCAEAIAAGEVPRDCRTKVTQWYCGCWQRSGGVTTFDPNITEANCTGTGIIPLYLSTTPFPGSVTPAGEG